MTEPRTPSAKLAVAPRGKPYTKWCIHCVKRRAQCWGGYMLDGEGKKVRAGWCRRCIAERDRGRLGGFYGRFVASLGSLSWSTIAHDPEVKGAKS